MLLLSISSLFIAALQAQIPPIACKGPYEQCGGRIAGNAPYTGPTCCISGFVCTANSPQYSQCNPGSPPPQIPQIPITPQAPQVPTNPTPPLANNPVNPTNPQRPPVPPVTPQQPPATPQYTQPLPQPGYPQYPQSAFPGFMPGMLDPQNLDCEFGQCRNRKITLSPGQGFQLNCKLARMCDGLDLTLQVGVDYTNPGSQVNEINDLNFDAPQNGVTVRINNVMAGNGIEVNNIHCKVFGACNNLKVIAGFGVELWNINVHCDQPGACTGCTINGQSCNIMSMMNGNNNGYLPYGYGYQNQPNQGVPPQNQGVPPQNQGVPPQNQGVPPQNQGVPPQNQGVPPQNQGVPPQNQGGMQYPAHWVY